MSALPSMEATRAHMDTLMKERDRIEKSILMAMKEHESLGVRLNEPLLDAQGYPRPELDLYRIRSLRNSIARQQNDLKTVMQKIENLLPQALPADNSSVNCQSIANRRPFARVGVVPSESFAFGVGICTDDLIVKFGALQSITSLTELKAEMDKFKASGKVLQIELLRNGSLIRYECDVSQVSGLGCEVKPL